MVLQALCFFLMIADDGAKNWSDSIGDMLSTNATRTAEGHVDYEIEIKPRKSVGDHLARLQAQVDWEGPKFFMRFRYYSEYEQIFGDIRKDPIDLAKWTLLMRNEREQIYYNPETNVFHAYGTDFLFQPLFYLSPPDLWGRCCPPRHFQGRPWAEMLGVMINDGELKTKSTTSLLADEKIRYDRVDPNGHKVSITYLLKQGGNVDEISSSDKDGVSHKYMARYVWSSCGDAWVMRSAEIDTYDPVSPKELTHISIKATNCSLTNKNKTMFIRENVTALCPESNLFIDHKTNKKIRLGNPAPNNSARMRDLAEKLKSRGFAKKP